MPIPALDQSALDMQSTASLDSNRYFHLTPMVVLLPADGFQWGCGRGADSLRKRTGPREGRQADEGWSNELRKNFLERDRKMMFTKNILSLLEKQSLPENRLTELEGWLNFE